MAAIRFTCPKCTQEFEAPDEMAGEIADCSNCGVQLVIPRLTTVKRFQCGKCGSDDCKKVSMVYEAGTSSGAILGLAQDDDGSMGVAGGIVQTTTMLAGRLAPPAEPSGSAAMFMVLTATIGIIGFICLIIMGSVSIVFLMGMAAVILVVCLIAGILIIRHRNEQKQQPNRMAEWERQWVCLKCGNIWS